MSKTTTKGNKMAKPSDMPKTAFRVDGVWYRNMRAYLESPAYQTSNR